MNIPAATRRRQCLIGISSGRRLITISPERTPARGSEPRSLVLLAASRRLVQEGHREGGLQSKIDRELVGHDFLEGEVLGLKCTLFECRRESLLDLDDFLDF